MSNRNSALDHQPNEGVHLLGTFAVVLLFLAFIGAGFYVFVSSYA